MKKNWEVTSSTLLKQSALLILNKYNQGVDREPKNSVYFSLKLFGRFVYFTRQLLDAYVVLELLKSKENEVKEKTQSKSGANKKRMNK